MKNQNLKEIVSVGLIVGIILATFPLSASAEWKEDRTGWWYTEGNSWTIGWRVIDGACTEEKQNASSSNKVLGKNLEQAVSTAIKAKGEELYLKGEAATEGHIILEVEEKGNMVKVYTISSFGYFGFENNIFTKISGSGAIPTVMVLTKNTDGTYTLVEYKEPSDGDLYMDSVKKMFPEKLWTKVLEANFSYNELSKSQEAQAQEYLKKIERTAKVSEKYVKRKRPDINVSAENKLFAELNKYDVFLNTCPYWLGTKEQLENGNRMIYETSQSTTSDGYDLITFKKTKVDGTIIEKRSYKIVGSEPILQ